MYIKFKGHYNIDTLSIFFDADSLAKDNFITSSKTIELNSFKSAFVFSNADFNLCKKDDFDIMFLCFDILTASKGYELNKII